MILCAFSDNKNFGVGNYFKPAQGPKKNTQFQWPNP